MGTKQVGKKIDQEVDRLAKQARTTAHKVAGTAHAVADRALAGAADADGASRDLAREMFDKIKAARAKSVGAAD
jgi:cell division septum initiation protein DivIVA